MDIEGYSKDMKVGEEDVKKKSCYRCFRLEETTYLSEVEISFPIVLKTDSGDYVRRELTAYIIDAEMVNFLLGRETIKDWRISLDFEEDKLEFKGKEKNVNLIESKGGHLLAQLEIVGTWKNKYAIYLVDMKMM